VPDIMKTPKMNRTAGQKIVVPPSAAGIQPTFFANQKNPIRDRQIPINLCPFL